MKLKDKSASIIYLIFGIVLWQFFLSIEKIIVYRIIDTPDNPIFEFQMVKNTGSAWGMLQNFPNLLGILGIIVLILVSLYVFSNLEFKDKYKILLSSTFMAGVLGNTVQRLSLGYVFDYIKIKLFDFPVFNFFDILICFSAFVFIIAILKDEIKRKMKKCK